MSLLLSGSEGIRLSIDSRCRATRSSLHSVDRSACLGSVRDGGRSCKGGGDGQRWCEGCTQRRPGRWRWLRRFEAIATVLPGDSSPMRCEVEVMDVEWSMARGSGHADAEDRGGGSRLEQRDPPAHVGGDGMARVSKMKSTGTSSSQKGSRGFSLKVEGRQYLWQSHQPVG
jgi:hypothetical protein